MDLKVVYRVQFPVTRWWSHKVQWVTDPDVEGLYETLANAEHMAEVLSGGAPHSVTRLTGSWRDIQERHTASDKRGRLLWRIEGVRVYPEYHLVRRGDGDGG
jgi:hypothetical protein